MEKLHHAVFAFLLVLGFASHKINPGETLLSLLGRDVIGQRRLSVIAPAISPALADSNSQVNENPPVDHSVRTGKEKFPCASLQIATSGAICDGYRLDLPKIDLKEILDEDRSLPRRSITVFVSKKFVDGILYRDIALELRWEPATPEFLQIYLEEYLPYWENRIPYRLFWDAQYEVCAETCSTFFDAGEFLPEDVKGLAPSLAADINFNGVPAAFWNVNINP